MKYSFGAVILAAGEGTRLKLEIPKPLATICGKRLIDFPIIEVCHFFKKSDINGVICTVTGFKNEEVEKYLTENHKNSDFPLEFALQKEQKGTADAIKAYFSSSEKYAQLDYTLIICADTPLIRRSDLEELWKEIIDNNLDGIAASFKTKNPRGYGRIVRGENGFHIVEEKDASAEIKKITEVNSGLYILKTSFLMEHLKKINSNNKSGEFYLTDLFQDEYKVRSLLFEDDWKFIGVNTLKQLEIVGKYLKNEKIEILRENGVQFIDSSTVCIDWNVEIEKGAIIHPHVVLEGSTKIESGVEIKPFTNLENAIVRKNATVGPFARLRPDADIGEKAKVGNFVEIKKATLEKGAKVSHLSYVGDALIGENTNIGCGFITCNYDGANKHFTKIGKDSFIGSDSQMCAPVEIGDRCFVASGSTITKSIPNDSFAISRGKQTTKNGMAGRFIKKK